jgi:thymidylate synthase (FAD)
MGQLVHPRAFLIAETKVDYAAMDHALLSLGVDGWASDGGTDADVLTEFAGKSCYMSFDKNLNLNLTKVGGRPNSAYIQDGIIGNKHGSVLEHSTVTFFLTNVSRVVTHELVRHRAGTAFSQTSGRYVRSNDVDMFLPKEIAAFQDAVPVFQRAVREMEENIAELVEITGIEDMTDFGLKKRLTSAFRRLIGNGQANHLVMTANHRAWRHIIEMRTSVHAEEEIRVIMSDVAQQLKDKFPTLYGDMSLNNVGEWVFAHSKV